MGSQKTNHMRNNKAGVQAEVFAGIVHVIWYDPLTVARNASLCQQIIHLVK